MRIPYHLFSIPLLTTCLLAAAPAWVNAEPHSTHAKDSERHGCFKGKPHRGKLQHLLRHLALSEEQEGQAQQLITEAKPKLQALMAELGEQKRAFHQQLMTGTPSQQQIEKAAELQGALKQQLILQRLQLRAAIYALLTPEQKEKVHQRLPKKHRP